jgi:hypothetical protein
MIEGVSVARTNPDWVSGQVANDANPTRENQPIARS